MKGDEPGPSSRRADYSGAARRRIRSILSRTKAHALALPGWGLVAADSIRHSRADRADRIRPFRDASRLSIAGVLVAITHWRSPHPPAAGGDGEQEQLMDRSALLVECIDNVLQLNAAPLIVAVLTNQPELTCRDLVRQFMGESNNLPVSLLDSISNFKGPFPHERQIVVLPWRPRMIYRHGRYLTWAHKSLFRNVLADPDLSLLVCLEDDLKFTDENLQYWCRFRLPLSAHGLLPGFVRFERMGGTLYALDQIWRQTLNRPRVSCWAVDGTSATMFVGLDQLHQGMYILDQDLARHHLLFSRARDPLRSRTVANWPAIERSAIGPMFDDVPPGFMSRNVVPVRDGVKGPMLEPPCLIEHLAGNYSRSPDSKFGKIPVNELFT